MATPGAREPSLYVADLKPDVTESMLFQKFSQAGCVLSVRVCRDKATKRSRGYAYVNFKHLADAQRALDTMNYDKINGRPCRIMWYQRYPSLRHSAVGNVFVKNLDRSIDSKALHETFSVFGNILSCKVLTGDDSSSSEGFGFVNFDTQESADLAIQKANGMLLKNKKIYVGKSKPRKEMTQDHRYTSVYFSITSEDVDDEKLVTTFHKFGKIVSVAAVTKKNGKSWGLGVVNFETHEAAHKAASASSGLNTFCAAPQKWEADRKEIRHVARLYRYASKVRPTDALFLKHALGMHIHPEILATYPEMAVKITGILLELDNLELICMLDKPERLKSKVEEVVAVLKEEQSTSSACPGLKQSPHKVHALGSRKLSPHNHDC